MKYFFYFFIIAQIANFMKGMELSKNALPSAEKKQLVIFELQNSARYEWALDLVSYSKTISDLIADAGLDTSIALINVDSETFRFIHEQVKKIDEIQRLAATAEDFKKSEQMWQIDLKAKMHLLAPESFVKLLNTVNYLNIPIIYNIVLNGCDLLKFSEELVQEIPLDLCRILMLKALVKNGPLSLNRESIQKSLKSEWVTSLCIAKENIITSCVHGLIEVWSMHDGKKNARYKMPRNVCQNTFDIVCVCCTHKQIFFGCGCTVRVLNSETGQSSLLCSGHTKLVSCLCNEGNKLISGSHDGTVRIWDLTSGAQLGVCEGHAAEITCVSSAGNKIISGSRDGTIRLWLLDTAAPLMICEDPLSLRSDRKMAPWSHRGWVTDICTQDDKIFSASSDESIGIWDLATGKMIGSCYGHTPEPFTSLCIMKNLLIAGSQKGCITIFDFATGMLLARCDQSWRQKKSYDSITDICVVGDTIICGSNFDQQTICLWNLALLKKMYDLNRTQIVKLHNYLKGNKKQGGGYLISEIAHALSISL